MSNEPNSRETKTFETYKYNNKKKKRQKEINKKLKKKSCKREHCSLLFLYFYVSARCTHKQIDIRPRSHVWKIDERFE